jgi:A/G-specific adenine glycosylase
MAGIKHNDKHTENRVKNARKQLLEWYDRHGRALPWRVKGGLPEPYHEWLSEIMLQQTTVNAVIPYFLKFVKQWPDVKTLAHAPREEIMRAWAGLGYYARARNLHACAEVVANEYGGVFPDTEADLKKLPGIGEYTAAAIAAIAFNKPATVMDGNIERVMARYFAIEEPLPKSKPELKKRAALFFDNFADRPGDLAQAMMDLGATVCIAAEPRCALCPLQKTCEGKIKGIAASLPRKADKKKRPQKYGVVYWITDGQGRVLVHRRPEKGLLGGMAGLPTSTWANDRKGIAVPPIIKKRKIRAIKMHVEHNFTHFDLRLDLKTLEIPQVKEKSYFWVKIQDMEQAGLPTVFKKARKIFENA